MTVLKWVIASLCVSVMTLPVVAATYTVDNVIVFHDDYEGGSAIGAGFDDDPGTTDFDPVASVGTWVTTEDEVNYVQVTDFDGTTTTSIDYPGAFQGDNYTWLNRPSGSGFNKMVGTPVSAATTGQAVHFEWMVYIPANTAGNLGVFSLYNTADATGDRIAGLTAVNDGSVGDGGSLNWTANTWEKWELDYVVGSTTYDLTIGGVQETGLAIKDAAAASGPANSFRFGSRNGVEYLVDAVPEPAGATLLLAATLGLLSVRRRR